MCLLVPLEPVCVERSPRREVRDDVDDAYAHVDDVRRRLQEVYPPELVEHAQLRRIYRRVEGPRRRVFAHLRGIRRWTAARD